MFTVEETTPVMVSYGELVWIEVGLMVSTGGFVWIELGFM